MSRRVELTRGYRAVVDDADYAAVTQHRWHARVDPYTVYAGRGVRRPDGGYATQRLHTFLTGWPQVDHIDGDGLNNQRSNLRPADRSENNQNSRKRAGSSQYKGVTWCKRERRWLAQIQHRKQHYGLGYHSSELAAAAAAVAYDTAARELFGEFARLNFPDQETRL